MLPRLLTISEAREPRMRLHNRTLFGWLIASLLFTGMNRLVAEDVFLHIPGVDGESQDYSQAGCIEVLAWSWGASNSGTTHQGSGSGAGAANFQNLSITKWVDTASPILLGKIATGSQFASAQLIVRKGGSKPVEYYSLKMTNVMVTSLSTGGSVDENRLTENISLNFAKVELTYIQLYPNGSPENPLDYGWDIAASMPFDSDTGSSDNDGDGYSDQVDRDDDNDGMSDSYEQLYGFNQRVHDSDIDSDGDTLTNREEFYLGTNPTQANSAFKAITTYEAGSNLFTISWPSAAGITYRVMSAGSLTETFLIIGEYPSDGDGTTSISMPMVEGTSFFKVEAIIP